MSNTKRNALLALGFRPFYLAGSVFAVVALPLWLLLYFGNLQFTGYLAGPIWHSHEMAFGFTSAVIAGFLLTAVRNWTGRATPTGAGLALLAAVWVAARILIITGPATVAMVVDLAFFPLLAMAVAVPIWQSRNVRNFKLLAVLAGLTAANVLFHFAYLNIISAEWLRISVTAVLDLITILMAVIGGRVIPAFTANAIPGSTPRHITAIEVVAFGALVGILALGILDHWMAIPKLAWLVTLLVAALAHAIRWLLWQPHRTIGNALLWMLPVAYAWIPISLLLRALSVQNLVPSAGAVHALTLGAISSLMLAMMMRSALGHTGRPLLAGPAEVGAFVLMQLAAIVRVVGTVVDPEHYRSAVLVSGVLGSLAFAVFVLRYGPMLLRSRVDGKSG